MRNNDQAKACQDAVNEALENAAVLIGDMADAEQAAGDKGAAISLNAAAIKVRNMKNG